MDKPYIMFQMQQLAEMKILYPEYQFDNAENLLKGTRKDTLMKVITYLIGTDLYSSKDLDNKVVIEQWFSYGNKVFAQNAYDRIDQYEQQGKRLKIVSVVSCLQMLQYALDLEDQGMLETKSKEQSEIDLYFAMLLLNQNMDYNQTKDKDKIRELFPNTNHYTSALLMNYSFSKSDIENFYFSEYAYCQVIKALLLFQFMASKPECTELLQRFYLYYSIAHWKEYFERVVPMILGWANRDKPSSVDLILEDNDKYEVNYRFLQQMAMSDYVKLQDVDYRKIREKPLIKLDDHTFRVIHPLFICDKVYKGLYFLFNQLNGEKPDLIKEFRSWYTSNFSEAICFREIIKYAMPKPDCLLFDDDLREKDVIGPPDGYLRLGSAAFLFESKDILINASIKSSYDFEKLINEIKKKLLVEDGRAVGIGQIIANIKKLLTGENKYDEGFDKDKSFIYPILITHDNMFDTAGLNRILGIFFYSALIDLKQQGLDVARVKPLIVMNIDFLIEAAPLLKQGKVTLTEVCEAFYANFHVKSAAEYKSEIEFFQAYQDSLLSFAHFVPHYLKAKLGDGWRSEDLLHHLFEKM